MRLAIIASTSLLVGPAIAEAAQVFTDRTSFLAAVGAVTTEGFESYATNSCTSGGPSRPTRSRDHTST